MSCPPEIAQVLLEVIKLALLRIRLLGWENNAEQCAAEADHVHNLPFMLSEYSEEALQYYLDVERPAFVAQCPDASQFETLWTELDRIVERQTSRSLGRSGK